MKSYLQSKETLKITQLKKIALNTSQTVQTLHVMPQSIFQNGSELYNMKSFPNWLGLYNLNHAGELDIYIHVD